MPETEGNGMEMESGAIGISIDRITEDRMANACQVSPQLVGSPRQWDEPKTGDISAHKL